MQIRIQGSKEEIEKCMYIFKDIEHWVIGFEFFKIVNESRYYKNHNGTYRKYITFDTYKWHEESED